MTQQRVLIVGAGALGLTCAYHLQQAQARISFLVRPHREQALARPQRLYCYNDDSVKELADYDLFLDPAQLQGETFDFVLLTLDGATCVTDSGVDTLRSLGRALAGTGCRLVICGVGIGLYEHIEATTGFAGADLLEGTMRMFAYQTAQWSEPLAPSVNAALHDSADIAFMAFASGIGFILASAPREASSAFAQLWDSCGISRCQRMPPSVYRMFSSMFFAFTVASELNGWQGTDALIADRVLWHRCCQSQREIMRLKQHGWMGKVGALLMRDGMMAKMMRDMDRDGEPLGFTAFNRFHHGGKVLAQDVGILENCLQVGEEQGRDMSATRALLEHWRRLHRL